MTELLSSKVSTEDTVSFSKSKTGNSSVFSVAGVLYCLLSVPLLVATGCKLTTRQYRLLKEKYCYDTVSSASSDSSYVPLNKEIHHTYRLKNSVKNHEALYRPFMSLPFLVISFFAIASSSELYISTAEGVIISSATVADNCFYFIAHSGDMIQANMRRNNQSSHGAMLLISLETPEQWPQYVGRNGKLNMASCKRLLEINKDEAAVEFEVMDSGYHAICLTNVQHNDDISFYYNVAQSSETSKLITDETEYLLMLSKSMGQKLQKIFARQHMALQKEIHMEDAVENTGARVMHWAVVQAVVILSLAILQVQYLRSRFEIKSVV